LQQLRKQDARCYAQFYVNTLHANEHYEVAAALFAQRVYSETSLEQLSGVSRLFLMQLVNASDSTEHEDFDGLNEDILPRR